MSDAAPPEPTSPTYLVATDDGNDPAYGDVREAGLQMARDAGATVILYDRSSESYLTDPYPVGAWSEETDAVSPSTDLGPDVLRGLGRGYLAEQLEAARSAGVDAHAHLAEGTGAEALIEACKRFSPDVVVLPEAMKRGRLVDRLRRNTLADLEGKIDAEVRLVDANGVVPASGP